MLCLQLKTRGTVSVQLLRLQDLDSILLASLEWQLGTLWISTCVKSNVLRGLPPQTFSWSRAPRKASSQNGNQLHVTGVDIVFRKIIRVVVPSMSEVFIRLI